MTQPDVAITDYLLTVESALFSVVLWRSDAVDSGLQGPFVVFFAATAVAALAGGTVHGFFENDNSGVAGALWRGTLVALGVVALAAWTIGARLLFPPHTARLVEIGAIAIAMGYTVVVVAVNDSFWIAIADYLPATIFLLIAFGEVYHHGRHLSTLVGMFGLAVTLAAALVQQRQIALHTVYFNHNALYHAMQAVALLMIFRAARDLI